MYFIKGGGREGKEGRGLIQLYKVENHFFRECGKSSLGIILSLSPPN